MQIMKNLTEAEIQVLASIQEAVSNELTASRPTLEHRSQRYWVFKQDWDAAFETLVNKQLVKKDNDQYHLTESGYPLAVQYYAQRPDLYWYYYQQFYDLAASSKTHSRFCEIVYGENRYQEGQTDMECFDDLLSKLDIKPGQQILDLGCGAGGLSEYIVDKFAASGTGIDNSSSAIRIATDRTQTKRAKLKFIQADLNTLDLKLNFYDAAISIDSIYWVADMDKSISSIVNTIKPGGKLYILIEHRMSEASDKERLDSKYTQVACSLKNLKLEHTIIDYSEPFLKFWPKAKQAALSLREQYVAEGNQIICDNWIREADIDYLPSVKAKLIRRYLYQIIV